MNQEFFHTLLDSMSVSGHEIPLQKKVIAEMKPHCDEIRTDYTGNVISILNPDAPFKVMLAAHIDEIGLVVTHIQENGLLRVGKAGGVRPMTYPGHQVTIHGENGNVCGVVAYDAEMPKKELKVTDLCVDIGAKTAGEAKKYVQPGDPVHPNVHPQQMPCNFFTARGIDDRGCAYIILEALKRARARGCDIGVYAVTTVGEETTGRGAYWCGSRVRPDVAIAVDVTFASDAPGQDPKTSGDVRLGGGPVLCNSSIGSRKINALLKSLAAEKNIPFQVETYMGDTCTDADQLHRTGDGVVTALVSLPLRYMHCPSEVCSLDDVENSVALLTELLCAIGPDTDLDPFHD